MTDLVATRDLRINASEHPDGTYDLVSEGLARRHLPELELVHVPRAHARDGAVIINQIAEYTANRSRIAAGERVGIAGPRGSLIARLVASEHAQGRLRIEEPIDDMPPLATMLSTVLLWRAEAAFRDGDDARGIATLRSAIELFPGDPTRRDAPSFGVEHNWENHLAYASLATHIADADGEAAIDCWERAAARCARFELDQLGDTAADVRRLERDALIDRARVIAETNTRTTTQEPISEHLVMTQSPIWRPAHDDERTGQAARKMNVVTRRGVYSAAPLLQDPELAAVAIQLVLAHREHPAALLFATTDTAEHWEGGSDEAPLVDTGHHYQTGDRLLSRALAHVARDVAAGMTATELRAAYNLVSDPTARDSALAKRVALNQTEFADQVAAMGR